MSIEQLESDLKEVTARCPKGTLVTASDMAAFLRDELLPLLALHIQETNEIDENVEMLLQRAGDILHEESAGLFLALIASAKILGQELKTRAAGDAKIQALVKEFEGLAEEAEALVHDITMPSEPEDALEDDAPAAEGSPQ